MPWPTKYGVVSQATSVPPPPPPERDGVLGLSFLRTTTGGIVSLDSSADQNYDRLPLLRPSGEASTYNDYPDRPPGENSFFHFQPGTTPENRSILSMSITWPTRVFEGDYRKGALSSVTLESRPVGSESWRSSVINIPYPDTPPSDPVAATFIISPSDEYRAFATYVFEPEKSYYSLIRSGANFPTVNRGLAGSVGLYKGHVGTNSVGHQYVPISLSVKLLTVQLDSSLRLKVFVATDLIGSRPAFYAPFVDRQASAFQDSLILLEHISVRNTTGVQLPISQSQSL